jgi:hypothetical protein
MAEKYEIEFEFNIDVSNINVATTNIVNFTEATEKAEKKSKDFGETVVGFGADVLENGTAMKMLNDVTDGYADKVKDAVEFAKLFVTQQQAAAAAQKVYTFVMAASSNGLKLFRAALAGTGIGAIALVIGVLIANFGKIKDKVMDLLGPLKLVGDFFGGIIDGITDFIGITSEASRELEKMAETAQEGLKNDEMMLEINGDKYDELTKRKIQADLDYRKRLKEIQDMDPEDMSDEEKIKASKDALDRKLRDEEKAETDSKANLLKILDNYHKRQEDANAKTAMDKIALEEKRALAELDLEKATEAQKNEVRNYYNGQRKAEDKKLADEAKQKRDEDVKAAIAKEKERNGSIKKIIEDYNKKQQDADAKTALQKIALEKTRALEELARLGAKEDQKNKIIAFYEGQRLEEEKKLAAESKKIQKDKDDALQTLALGQRKWEASRMTDALKKLEAERKILEDEAQLEKSRLQEELSNTELSEEAKASAQVRMAEIEQELTQARTESDEQQAKVVEDKKKAEKDKAKNEKDAKEKSDEELAQKKMDLAFVTTSFISDLANKEKEGEAKRTEEQKEDDRSVAQNRLNVAGNTAKMLLEMGGKGAELAKGMAVAQAVQDTYKGATSAYSSMAGIPVVGPALGAAAAGVAVASGLMNVKKILATKSVEKSAPGGGSGGGGTPPPAPAFNLVQGTGTNQIAESIANQNTPIQAYVVSSNVTSAQSLDRNIVEQSSL